MSRIITKANIKEELRRIVNDNGKASKLDMGIDFVLAVITGVSDERTEKEIYKFLASVLDCTAEEIENSDPIMLLDRLRTEEGHEQWADFFTKVWKLTQKKI